jgi:hypothetical protein
MGRSLQLTGKIFITTGVSAGLTDFLAARQVIILPMEVSVEERLVLTIPEPVEVEVVTPVDLAEMAILPPRDGEQVEAAVHIGAQAYQTLLILD